MQILFNKVMSQVRFIWIGTLMFLQFTAAIGQGQSGKVSLLDAQTNPAAIIDEIPIAQPKFKGSYFYNDDFIKGDVFFITQKKIENTLFRYDLLNETIEVKTQNDHSRIVGVYYVDKIEVTNNHLSGGTQLINIRRFDKYASGLLRIIKETSSSKLAEKLTVEIKEANYSPVLNVGSRDHQYIKKRNLTYIVNNEIIANELDRTVKSIRKAFDMKRKTVSKYLKSNNLSLSNDNDLLQVLDYFNYTKQ